MNGYACAETARPSMLVPHTVLLRACLRVAVLALLILVMTASGAEAAKRKKRAQPQPDRYASIVIEAETGYVISEKNADLRRYPASLTKIMTLYLTFEAIQQGRISKSTRIPVSRHAAFQEPSELGLAAGSTIRVEDAILGLVTKSANDAAVALAEALGGSESRFAEMMTTRAHQLGMKNTSFKNASGLHNPRQFTTARDMAILGQAVWRDFPRDYRYFSTRQFSYGGRVHANHNKLMNTYAGMDGIKTGFINASGFNLVASAKRNGTRLIGVVFGGQTTKSRNDHMAQLLDLGFERVTDLRVAEAVSDRPNTAAAAPLATTRAANLKVAGTQPSTATVATAATTHAQRAPLPRFDAIGLVSEQGDRSEPDTTTRAPGQETASSAQSGASAVAAGGWAIQVGAFSSHEAGMSALRTAHKKLSQTLTAQADYVIVPLMTNRGIIYRARMTGLDYDRATSACAALAPATCLVLTAE